MLALALGLNVTVFTVMNSMLFRGFPLVKRNDRLLYMQERFPSGICCLSYPDFEDWRSQAHSFEGMAFVVGRPITLSDGDQRALDTSGALVSANAFALLGVSPALGRDFNASDETPGAPAVVLLNHRFWVSHFDRRSDIIGLTVRINKAPATIIGVMPEGFDFPSEENLYQPVVRTPELQRRGPGGYMAFGRLREGVTVQQARAELAAINLRLEAEYPATNRGVTPRVDTHSQFFIGPDATLIYGSLWAAAWFVLLIACANLANLALARTMGRSHEFSTRIALGAGRMRMMRQILLEGLALAATAGALGWWIAQGSVRAWAAATASRYQILDYRVDAGTLAYLAGVSLAAAILVSMAPMGRIWQLGANGVLKSDARGVTQGLRAKRLAAALVVGQMALAIMLLAGAGVLVRSLLNVVSANTGVQDPEHVLAGWIALPSGKYTNAAQRLAYFDRLETRLRTIPGVVNESVANTIPVNSVNPRAFEIDGRPAVSEAGQSAQFLSVGPDYFQVVGAPAISGRNFNPLDSGSAAPVALVNQSFAARFSPGEQPVGRRLRSVGRGGAGEWRTVIGVVPNLMQGDPTRQAFKPVVYVPFPQEPAAGAYFLVRTAVPPARLAQAVRSEVQQLDPDVTLEDFGTLKASFAFRRDRMDLEHAELGKYAAVAPIFAMMALLLAAVGLYAVIARSMSRRTREIGVRMALGAAPASIRAMVLRDGMAPVFVGLLVGLAASLAVNRILGSQLVGVSSGDPITLAAALGIMIAIALLACHIPAHRAMNVDPAVALRHD